MEPDFVTRQHLESVPAPTDPETRRLLNSYKFPPSQQPSPGFPVPPKAPPAGTFPVFVGGQTDALILSNMIGQLQGTLQQNQTNKSNLGGLNLSIDSDVLKWLLLIVVIVALILLVLKLRPMAARRNPMTKRMKKIERELKMLRKNPELLALHKKTKTQIPDDDDEE